MNRVHRTSDGYLRYAEHNQAAYRAIVGGGVLRRRGHAIRDGVRGAIVEAIAEGAYGRCDIGPPARMGLLSWVCGLSWIERPGLPRKAMRDLLVKALGGALRAVEELDPAPPDGTPDAGAEARAGPRPRAPRRPVSRSP
ncbi:hypothetical protein GCM10010216_31240 [Streptomyces flaveolus]|nr:hypothetical protein GCM10010216_31240 [Streptomyces flaveolus]